MNYIYTTVNKCVFNADLNQFSEVLQVTLDGRAFYTPAAAWTNVVNGTAA